MVVEIYQDGIDEGAYYILSRKKEGNNVINSNSLNTASIDSRRISSDE